MVMITQNVVTIQFAGICSTYYRCLACGEWFLPGVPWDEYCAACWDREAARMVNNLADREGE